ncbi:MAG: hypothetical protein Kow0069_20830 [Promethearchaeota archaeon]
MEKGRSEGDTSSGYHFCQAFRVSVAWFGGRGGFGLAEMFSAPLGSAHAQNAACSAKMITLFDAVTDRLRDALASVRLERPPTLNELALSKPFVDVSKELEYGRQALDRLAHGKVCFFKVDGNNFGIVKSQMATPHLFRTFAEKVQGVTFEAIVSTTTNVVRDELERLRRDEGATIFFPFQEVILGGDDIALLMNAKVALRFIHEFFKTVRREFGPPSTQEGGGDILNYRQERVILGERNLTYFPSGYSGGAVFADMKTPLEVLSACVDELENKAKAYGKGKVAEVVDGGRAAYGAWSSIALYDTTTGDYSPERVRSIYEEFHGVGNHQVYKLCRFPMTDLEFEEFLEELREIQRNKRHLSLNRLKTLVRRVVGTSTQSSSYRTYSSC